MKKICDGSRRRVLGKRHKLTSSDTGHMKAMCPVCNHVITVTRVMGVTEFPRHAARNPKK
jgi:hypothetical protein